MALVYAGPVGAAPIVVVAAVGTEVSYGAKALAVAVPAARLAHARSRVAAERCRRDELAAQAARLRHPVPEGLGIDREGTAELNLLADRLAAQNDRLGGELAAEQLMLNQLSTRRWALEGRRETLTGWGADADLAFPPGVVSRSDPGWSAVQQAEHQVAALARTVVAMEAGLRAAHGERQSASTEDLWPPVAEIDRHPQSSSERWRAPLRTALERGLQDAAIGEELLSGVTAAFKAVEAGTDESSVRPVVEAAIAALTERVAHEAVVRRNLRTLNQLANEAEGSENYVVLAECDLVLAEFAAHRQRLDAAALDTWANNRFHAVEQLLLECERVRAEHLAKTDRRSRSAPATGGS